MKNQLFVPQKTRLLDFKKHCHIMILRHLVKNIQWHLTSRLCNISVALSEDLSRAVSTCWCKGRGPGAN